MKKQFGLLLSMFIVVSHLQGQTIYLPYGQTTQEEWPCACYNTSIYTSISEDWVTNDFDESEWSEGVGPFSSLSNMYAATPWHNHYTTYWVRRHFIVTDLYSSKEYYFDVCHDDGCEAYLNGQVIYNQNGVVGAGDNRIVKFGEELTSMLRLGDNVLAIRVSDTGGGESFLDCGLTGYPVSYEYSALENSCKKLKNRLSQNTSKSSPKAVSEARQMVQSVSDKIANQSITSEEALQIKLDVDRLINRLDYTFLRVNLSTPGSLGDSVLAHFENFTDLYSLSIKGKINETDIYNIQNRLTQLREIDFEDLEMTTIPNRLFNQRTLLQTFYFPKNLNKIEEYAFYRCYSLYHVNLPNSLRQIDYAAFAECDSLQEAILPEGVTTLGNSVFHNCHRIKYAKVPSTIANISNSTFREDTDLRRVDFSEGLVNIYDCAFYNCNQLKQLTFPSTLRYIDFNVFAYNRRLESVEFNEGLYQINDNAFYACDSLKEVTLPSSLVLINESPFDYCYNLTKVTCLSINPPYMTDQIPVGANMEGRTLYCPAMSINTYKQTYGWDKFPTILPIEYQPDLINILDDIYYTVPASLDASYKPEVRLLHDKRRSSYNKYGAFTVNGPGTLSMREFRIVMDPNYQYDQPSREQNYCTLVTNSHMRADQVTYQLYTPNDRWAFISFPFDVKLSDIVTTEEGVTNWIIRRYDSEARAAGQHSDTWKKVAADETLEAGRGYIIQSSRYINNQRQGYSGFKVVAVNNTHKNDLFRTEDAKVSLTEYLSEFPQNRSWNFVGNPYPCYFDTRFMDFTSPFIVWDMRQNNYVARSPIDDSYVLCPGEAFFVQRPFQQTEIVFSKEGRQINRRVRELEHAPRRILADDTSNRSVINLILSDGSLQDQTRIVINSAAALAYEMECDASKFLSDDMNVPQLYSVHSDISYAINERPLDNGIVQLALRVPDCHSVYTLSLPEVRSSFQVYLEDKLANQYVLLTADQPYSFRSTEQNVSDRFVLHFENETSAIDTIEQDKTKEVVHYDLSGRPVQAEMPGFQVVKGQGIVINK